MFLVGLGNFILCYVYIRYNVGFDILDLFVSELDFFFIFFFKYNVFLCVYKDFIFLKL